MTDAADPLYRFNYAHFHRTHLREYAGLAELITKLDQLNESGVWKGNGLLQLIAMLQAIERE